MVISKRGISAVVATVLIILITVAGITLIWTTVMPMLKEKTSYEDMKVDLSIVTSGGYTIWDEEKSIACVQVKLGSSSNVSLFGVQVLFSVDGETISRVFNSSEVPKMNEQTSKCFWLPSKPESVSIAPIFSTGAVGNSVSELDNLPKGSVNEDTRISYSESGLKAQVFSLGIPIENNTIYFLNRDLPTSSLIALEGIENVTFDLNGFRIYSVPGCVDASHDSEGFLCASYSTQESCEGAGASCEGGSSSCVSYSTQESCGEDWDCYWESKCYWGEGVYTLFSLYNSRNIKILNGEVEAIGHAFYLDRSEGFELKDVDAYTQTDDSPLYVNGYSIEHYLHDIDTSNNFNGKKVWYYTGEGKVFTQEDFDGAGYFYCVGCKNNIFKDLDLSSLGLFLGSYIGLRYAEGNLFENILLPTINSSNGVNIYYSQGNSFKNISLLKAGSVGDSGLNIHYSNFNLFEGILVNRFNTGVYMLSSSNNIFRDINSTYNSQGVYLYGPSSSAISTNNSFEGGVVSYNTQKGIYLIYNVLNNTFKNLQVINNSILSSSPSNGIYLVGSGLNKPSNNIFENNIVCKNKQYDFRGSTIGTGNVFTNNICGTQSGIIAGCLATNCP